MSDTVIRVENLSKRYVIGRQQQEKYTALRDVIASKAKGITRLLHPNAKNEHPSLEEFWALKDVSFEVKQGDRIGIIGRNGAGKSTLLKILSRITEPTEGRISIKGRVASLLEVGTGFHPELTGRENIFLNGAILGMSKVEIRRKFDEIVAFAEVERFLDTPVKRYSSGMYVRLAFAVAAHLEPEILVVDEVLAVGDAQFQKKCLGKMKDVTANEGRTILFVSHNMSAMQSLCEECLVLKEGLLITKNSSAAAVQLYLQDAATSNTFERSCQLNSSPKIISGYLSSPEKNVDNRVHIAIQIFSRETKHLSLDLRLTNNLGIPVGFGSLGTLRPNQLIKLNPDKTSISFSFDANRLAVGTYFISLDLTLPDIEYYDRAENCLSFEVTRPPGHDYIRVLKQSWGYGDLEIPLEKISKEHLN